MSAKHVITHVVESEPLFITLSGQPEWFTSHFVGGGIIWQHLAFEEKNSQELRELFQEAHRIIVDTSSCSPELREPLITALLPHQEKVKLVLPIYSYWQLRVAGEIPGWYAAASWQKAQILHWMSRLPDANALFVRDILDWQQSVLFSMLLTQHWSGQLLYLPDGKAAPAQKKDLITMLTEEFGAPPRSSVLLQTSEWSLTSLFERAIPLYESMYSERISRQEVETTQLQLLPFPCRVREATTTLNGGVDRTMLALPSPSQKPQLQKQLQHILKSIAADPWLIPDTAPTPMETAPLPFSKNPPSPQTIRDVDQNATVSSAQSVGGSVVRQKIKTIETPAPPISTETENPTVPILTEVEKELQLKEDVRRIFSTQGISQHTQVIERKSQQRRVVKKRSRKRTAVFYIGLIFVSFGLLFAALLGSLQITQQLVRREFLAVATGITESSVVSSEAVRWGKLPLLLSIMKPQQAALSTMFSLPVIDSGQAIVAARLQLQEAVQLRIQLNQNLILMYDVIMGQADGDLAQIAGQVTKDSQAAVQLSELFTATTVQLPEPMPAVLASAAAQVLPNQSSRRSELLSNSVLPKITELAGGVSRRRYAVVLQNSQELRPTGGFIEAIAVVTFEGGSLINQEVYSSYSLDKLIPGEVVPPADLTSTVGEKQWWVHDANWQPDGVSSGRQVTWFLEKTLQQTTDGVIFINTAGLPHLLKSLGPIELTEFNEVLTEKNIGERLEYHNEVPTQVAEGKTEYRQELLKQILLKITTLPSEQVLTFYQTLQTLADEKHILFTLVSPEETQIFRQLGWTGDLTFPTCPTKYVAAGCVTDGLAIVESNIGANRSNAYIRRIQSHEAVLAPTGVRHERKIQYTNTATTKAWPKGDYRVYLRAYMPGKPVRVSVLFDGAELAASAVTVRDSEFGTELGFVVTIPIASTKELIVHYELAQPLSPTSTYVFYENRQAGLTDPLPSLVMKFPQNWLLASSVPKTVHFDNSLQFPESPTAYLMRVVQFTPAQ